MQVNRVGVLVLLVLIALIAAHYDDDGSCSWPWALAQQQKEGSEGDDEDQGQEQLQQQLRADFYDDSCPQVFQIVRTIVQQAVKQEPRMAASLLRLHFHDCFVNGCDGSDLLDDTPSFRGEKNAAPNRNSLRGFEVVDAIKATLERECPSTVSCADILAIAARDSVFQSGGPRWPPLLGRRDSMDANESEANQALPSPMDNLDTIVTKFRAVGLSAEDVVILSGAHTMGLAHCATFSNRLYNFQNMASRRDPTLSSQYATHLEKVCPLVQSGNLLMTSALDPYTPYLFDNTYYQNLLRGEGLLQSDQELFCSDIKYADLYSRVSCYAHNSDAFFSDFANSMVKMGNIFPLIGPDNGQIRKYCRFINPF